MVNQTGHWNTFSQHGEHNATTARKWDTSPKCVNPKSSGGYKKNHQRTATPSHNTEIDHIQSVNGINRIDFYKAILLVQGQPIEFIIDTGSPVTIIPPIINTAEIHKTTKSFVDVNKNPIRFKGEAMVEVKTEKAKKHFPY